MGEYRHFRYRDVLTRTPTWVLALSQLCTLVALFCLRFRLALGGGGGNGNGGVVVVVVVAMTMVMAMVVVV